ncbi:MAG: TolC family protein, partial [Candidatus Saganbacteria bacterium]|nr:TolC family protein [Candidatus Saganbacteria bacterium]
GLIIAQEELDKTAQQVEFDVVNAYYNYIKASKLVLLNGESVNMAQGHLDQVNALLSVGMATKADVLRGEVQLAQAKIGLTKAWQALEIAKNTFNNILGRPLNTPVEIEEAEYPSADVVIYAYPDLLTLAYDGRPDWQQYILGEEIAEDEVRLAYSELWPSISLVGNVERSATKYSAYESDSYNWTALLSGSWTLFDGTANFNKIAEARANLDAKQAEQISVERAIALEVKEANFSLKSAKDNLSLTKTVLDLALENYEMAEQRYKAGVGTSLEEIDAQVALTESRIEYVDAQHALQIAMAKINKVVAGDIY